MAEQPRRGAKRVLETGLAVVHRDEVVFPAAGSEAQAELALDDQESAIVVYFPVEVEIRTAPADVGEMRRIVEEAMQDLAGALAARS